MMLAMIVMKVEFGPMEKHELNALKGDLLSLGDGKENCQQLRRQTLSTVMERL